MKDKELANSEGTGGRSKHLPRTVRITAYATIALLLIFAVYVYNHPLIVPPAVQRVAMITSWYDNPPVSTEFSILRDGPDLEVRLIAVGSMSKTGTLVPNTSLERSAVAAVRLTVTNVGNEDSLPWHLAATLPIGDNYEYDSGELVPLSANEARQFLLTFDKLSPGRGIIAINVESAADTDQNNNHSAVTVEVH